MISKKFINSPFGAPCTYELKKKVRQQIENKINLKNNLDLKEYEQIKQKIELINKTIDNNKKTFNNKLINQQNSHNLFSGNFETKMKKKDNVIPH